MDITARGMAVNNAAAINKLSSYRRLRLVTAGDSITEGSTGKSGGGNFQFGISYANYTAWKCGARFEYVANAGVGGNTSTQLLARWATDVLAKKPDVILLMIGTNDLVTGVGAIPTLMNNVQEMVRTALAAGALPVVVTPTAHGTQTDAYRQAIPHFYRLAQAWDVPLIDAFQLTVDPITGLAKAGILGDSVHPNNAGIVLIGDYVSSILLNLGSYQPRPYLAAVSEATYDLPANLIRNGSFALQTAGKPDGWSYNLTGATVTAAAAPAAPYSGKETVYTKSTAGAVYAVTSSDFHAAVGDVLQISGSLEVSGLPGSPTGYTLGFDWSNMGAKPITSWAFNGNFAFCQKVVVEAGAPGGSCYLYTADTGTFKLRNITVINLTAMDAIWKPSR